MTAVSEPIQRPYSRLSRLSVGDGVVYAKFCEGGSKYITKADVSAQVRREALLLQRFTDLGDMPQGLGIQRLHEADPAAGLISTYEVSGEPLEASLKSGRSRLFDEVSRAFHLAGHWLRKLQSLPTDGLVPPSSPSNPEGLVDQCRVRLDHLKTVMPQWIERQESRILARVSRGVEQGFVQSPARVLSHGDYGPYNLLWDGSTLTPIDFSEYTVAAPLADVTYLIHRLEVRALSAPWRRLPIKLWRREILRGYGEPDAIADPMYDALMVRWLLSRMKKLTARRTSNRVRRLHNKWLLRRIQKQINTLVGNVD